MLPKAIKLTIRLENPCVRGSIPPRATKNFPAKTPIQGYLARHKFRDEKDGPMFSGTTFMPFTTRSNKTAIEVSIGIFDFDGVDPNKIGATLVDAGYRAVLVT